MKCVWLWNVYSRKKYDFTAQSVAVRDRDGEWEWECRCEFFSFLQFTLTTATMTEKKTTHSLFAVSEEMEREREWARWWIVNCLTHRKSQTNHLHLITIYASCLVCMWCNAIQSNRSKQQYIESERERALALYMLSSCKHACVPVFVPSSSPLAKACSVFTFSPLVAHSSPLSFSFSIYVEWNDFFMPLNTHTLD